MEAKRKQRLRTTFMMVVGGQGGGAFGRRRLNDSILQKSPGDCTVKPAYYF